MIRRALLPSIAFLSACGGAPPRVETAHVEAPKPVASTPSAAPRAPLGIPRDAPLVAIFALAHVASLPLGELESSLGLPAGALSGDLVGFGAAPNGSLTLALAPLPRDADVAIDDLRAGRLNDVIAAIHRIDDIPVLFGFRVLVSASDPAKLERSLLALVKKGDWQPEGGGYRRPHRAIAISSDASSVAIDLALALNTHPTPAALERVMSVPMEPPPSHARDAHLTWSPERLARLPFLSGLSATLGAVSGEGVAMDKKRSIFAEGLKEAGAVFALAERDGKPIFDRVDVVASAAPFAVTLRAKAGPGFTMPPEAAFGAGASIAFPGATAELSESVAMLGPVPLAPDPIAIVRDAGELAQLVGLPQMLLAAPLDIPRMSHSAGPSDEVARHFERIGESWTASGDEIWFGVLPAGTKRDAAQCSLTTDAICRGATKLAVNGKPTKQGHGFARLVEVDHRFVLLLAKDAAPLGSSPKATSAGPLHFEGEAAGLGTVMRLFPIPAKVDGDLSRDGDAIVFRLASP